MGSLISTVEGVSLYHDGDCGIGSHAVSVLYLAQVFVWNYHYELGLWWSQCPDFDHSI